MYIARDSVHYAEALLEASQVDLLVRSHGTRLPPAPYSRLIPTPLCDIGKRSYQSPPSPPSKPSLKIQALQRWAAGMQA